MWNRLTHRLRYRNGSWGFVGVGVGSRHTHPGVELLVEQQVLDQQLHQRLHIYCLLELNMLYILFIGIKYASAYRGGPEASTDALNSTGAFSEVSISFMQYDPGDVRDLLLLIEREREIRESMLRVYI